MKDHYMEDMIDMLAKHGVTNQALAEELAEYLDNEQFQSWCDGLGDEA